MATNGVCVCVCVCVLCVLLFCPNDWWLLQEIIPSGNYDNTGPYILHD